MIQIIDKRDCCGCESCRQVCPKDCIRMVQDVQGFYYPQVNTEQCIDCHLCEKSCPVLQRQESEVISCYAAKNKSDEVRSKSSSGGIFTSFAQQIINEGGVVFGARFDKQWNVEHYFTETIDGLDAFQGSKYVQSRIGDSFKYVKAFLKAGRKVLFCGTPCQVSGLRLYLKRQYENLICIEVACHGVPSPKVWKDYVSELGRDGLTAISFRDKSVTGWRKYVYRFSYENRDDKVFYFGNNVYSDGFLYNFIIRPSCFQCSSKLKNSRADILIGDYWGVENYHPELDDDMGTSAVIAITNKGKVLIEEINLEIQNTSLQNVVNKNPSIVDSIQCPKNYLRFRKNYSKSGLKTISLEIKNLEPTFFERAYWRIVNLLKR